MKIEATYFDGFTEHLLRWKLIVNDSKAYLEADWFRSQAPVRTKFRFDEGPFRSALPKLAGMEEDYRPPWEDLEDRDLLVLDGDTSIHRHVYGAGILAREHLCIRDFLDVWKLLDEAVFVHLPRKLRD